MGVERGYLRRPNDAAVIMGDLDCRAHNPCRPYAVTAEPHRLLFTGFIRHVYIHFFRIPFPQREYIAYFNGLGCTDIRFPASRAGLSAVRKQLFIGAPVTVTAVKYGIFPAV